MKSSIFREYDIRGIVGKEFEITETYKLAKAIISYFLKMNPLLKEVVLGMDGRLHSPAIKKLVTEAITGMGIDVIDIGVCPTPVMYYSIFNSSATSGLIITASHNPKEYNGIKICLDQRSIYGEQIQEIKRILENEEFASSPKVGIVTQLDAISEYISWLKNHFKHLKNKPFNVMIDCANATAGTVLPKLIEAMKWKNVKLIYEELDGNFPNHEADPTKLENMRDLAITLKQNQDIDIGIGFDGDCDRMAPLTKNGYLVPGDKLLALYSRQVLEKHPKTSIVFDIKSSHGLIELLRQWGAKDFVSPSGHSLIKNSMIENKALLAGELSCHFFFKDRYFGYDDGIYAMMRLFEILSESDESLDRMLKIFPEKINTPEIRINCTEESKMEILKDVKTFFEKKQYKKLITIDGVLAVMGYGWGLIRLSNTQSVICLRFESETETGLNQIKRDFLEILEPYFESKVLKDKIGN